MASARGSGMVPGSAHPNSSVQARGNAARNQQIMGLLSGFANQALAEWGIYPGMAQEMEALKAEIGALKKELSNLNVGFNRLWQDNEVLDKRVKVLTQERDYHKNRTESLSVVLSQNPDSLHSLCLKLKQENDRLKLQHVNFAKSTERLINDGLALGFLVKSPSNPHDALSFNVHFRRSQAPADPKHAPSQSLTQQASVNAPQHAVVQSPTLQQPPNVQHTSRHHLSSAFNGGQPQPQLAALHRIQPNHPGLGSPVAQYLPQNTSPLTSQHPHTILTPPSSASHRSLNPYSTVQPIQPGILPQSQHLSRSPSAGHPSPLISTVHPQLRSASYPVPQVPRQSQSVPLENQAPQSDTVPLENQLSRSYTISAPPGSSQASSLSSPSAQSALEARIFNTAFPISALSSSAVATTTTDASRVTQAAPNIVSTPTLTPTSMSAVTKVEEVQIVEKPAAADVEEVKIIERVPIQGPAPPTPPLSDKARSPEQEQIRSLSLKRASIGMEGDESRPSLPKRIRLNESEVARREAGQTEFLKRMPFDERAVSRDEVVLRDSPKPMHVDEAAQHSRGIASSPQPMHMGERIPPPHTALYNSGSVADTSGPSSDSLMSTVKPLVNTTIVHASGEPAVDLTISTSIPTASSGEIQSVRGVERTQKEQEKSKEVEAVAPVPDEPPIAKVNEGNGDRLVGSQVPNDASSEDVPVAGNDQHEKEEGNVVVKAVEGENVEEEEEEEEEEESDEETDGATGRSERDACDFLLKPERSKNYCTLCRLRRDRYPDDYSDTIFDRDAPLKTLVDHFSITHYAAWCRLRGIAEGPPPIPPPPAAST